MGRARLALVLGGLAVLVAAGRAQTTADEEVARRQLDSGRSFLRQGDYTEALKDFRAVAETHASSSVADDALLEIARYYIDIAGDLKQASAAVDMILQKYPTSNSAPDAYVIAGRLALARSHQGADLDAALANFERVFRLFPESPAVPRALQYAGETLWYSHRLDDALADLGRVEVEYPTDPAAAGAYLNASLVRVSQGDAVTAMEELQEIRNRWPASPEASTALARLTLLHRLYVRARSGPAYALSPDAVGPAKLENVLSLAVDDRGTLHWATESALGSAAPPAGAKDAAKLADVAKPRGLTLDAAGGVVVLDGGLLRPATGASVACVLPRPSGQVVSLSKLSAAAQLSNGDWIVMDEDERAIHRFSRTGTYVGQFATVRVSRLAINAFDEVAGLDRDQKSVVLFDATGKIVGRIPLRAAGYDLQNAEDLHYDAFGHLYVLDRTAIAVFSPYAAPAAGPAGAPAAKPAPAAAGDRGATYRLATQFSEPEKSTTGFHRATAFAVDPSGAIYLYDDRAQRIMVYR